MESEGLSSLSREHLEALQLRKLNAVLHRERQRRGFYRHLPGTVESLSELATLPTTSQDDLLRHSGAMLLSSQAFASRIVSDATTGTSGSVKKVYYSQGDLANTIAFFTAGLGELVSPGDKVLIGFPRSRPDGLSSLIASAIGRLGAIPILPGLDASYARLKDLVERESPGVFVGMPVPLLSLSRMLGGSSISRAVVSADTLPPSVEAAFSLALGRTPSVELFPHYGSRELCLGGAFTCREHGGMHIRENHLIPEIVDERGHPVPRGEFGELVITTVGMELLPLIRYRTGDRARLIPGGCGCSSVTSCLDGVRRIRRGVDMSILDDALFEIESLIDYELAMRDGRVSVFALTVDGRGGTQIKQRLKGVLGDRIVELQLRRATLADGPLYLGKREVRVAAGVGR